MNDNLRNQLIVAHNQIVEGTKTIESGIADLQKAMSLAGLAFGGETTTRLSGRRDIPLSLEARKIAEEIAEENKRAGVVTQEEIEGFSI